MEKFNIIKLFIYDHRKKLIIGSSCLLVIIIGLIAYVSFDNYPIASEPILYVDAKKEEEKPVETDEEIIYYFVDVKGAVNNPGVYSVETGKRIIDVLNKAGGLKQTADTSMLNLSMVIKDAMVIKVYTKQEVSDYVKTKETEKKVEEMCYQEVKNDACIDESNNNSNDNNNDNNDDNDDQNNTKNDKININSASIEQLMTLSGIGEAKAKAIISYRDANGSFKDISEIMNVSGIGESVFAKIKDFITI